MNLLVKTIIGIAVGAGAIWSLGGFKSSNNGDNNNSPSNEPGHKKPAPGKMTYKEYVEKYGEENILTPNEDGLDGTDLIDLDAEDDGPVFSTRQNSEGEKESSSKWGETRKKFINNIKTVQDSFSRIRGIFDFFINIGTAFLELFRGPLPNQRVMKTSYVF